MVEEDSAAPEKRNQEGIAGLPEPTECQDENVSSETCQPDDLLQCSVMMSVEADRISCLMMLGRGPSLSLKKFERS